MKDFSNSPGVESSRKAFVVAWIIATVFYFIEYAVRSSPAVMITQLEGVFHIDALALSAILVKYYFTYSITSLIAGVALDRWGGKSVIAFGSFILGIGCVLFAVPSVLSGDIGRLLQGAGSAFAFTGCVYLATHGFSAKFLATAIGITQCVGMLGGSAGQFVSGALINNGFSVESYWGIVGIASVVVAAFLYFVTPGQEKEQGSTVNRKGILVPYRVVFTNSQSYLSGILSGLLFAPTTIFAMTWGVAFLKEDLGFTNSAAVIACALVPLGWVIGCPLTGWWSDYIGKRKPVLTAGILVMLAAFGQLVYLPQILPVWLSLSVFGLASGVAMIPYSIIKEANPDEVKGSATGGMNFLVFGVTSLLGPFFGKHYGKTLQTASDHAAHFKAAGTFFIVTTIVALILSIIIRKPGMV